METSSGSTSDPLRRPVLIAAFRGWNDGGQAATLAGGTLVRSWNARRDRRDRPRGLRRLPGDPADGDARRGADAQHRVARERLPRRPDSRGRSRRRDPDGGRAELPLACLQRAHRRLRPRTRRRARRHARRAACRRAAHARRPGDGCCERPLARRRARVAAVAVRGADGDRRGSARRVPAGGDPHREPLVGRAALRLARAEPTSRRALCDRLGELLGIELDLSDLEEAEELYAEQITEAVASDPETAAYVEELERRADSIDELLDEDDLPTGESLAAELSQFLRDRESGDPPAN